MWLARLTCLYSTRIVLEARGSTANNFKMAIGFEECSWTTSVPSVSCCLTCTDRTPSMLCCASSKACRWRLASEGPRGAGGTGGARDGGLRRGIGVLSRKASSGVAGAGTSSSSWSASAFVLEAGRSVGGACVLLGPMADAASGEAGQSNPRPKQLDS